MDPVPRDSAEDVPVADDVAAVVEDEPELRRLGKTKAHGQQQQAADGHPRAPICGLAAGCGRLESRFLVGALASTPRPDGLRRLSINYPSGCGVRQGESCLGSRLRETHPEPVRLDRRVRQLRRRGPTPRDGRSTPLKELPGKEKEPYRPALPGVNAVGEGRGTHVAIARCLAIEECADCVTALMRTYSVKCAISSKMVTVPALVFRTGRLFSSRGVHA